MEELYRIYLNEHILDALGKYAIYLRKSRADIESEEKGEGETLLRHARILLELAKKHEIRIGKIYREIVSGESIENRPEMQELLIDVRNNKWEGVLVVEVERLARGETMDQGIVAKAFQISNTKIITPMKIYDPNNEFDEEYFEFGLFMSRREYKVINRRLQRGRISSVNEGKYVGSIAPFGYDRVKIKGDKGFTLAKNKEASTVKIMYDLYAYENLSIGAVARRLNEMGLKPRKNDQWTLSTVKATLENPVYIGKIKWNCRAEKKVYKNGKVTITRPRNENYILTKGLHESIIDEKTWEIVVAKRSLNVAPVKHSDIVRNPLMGLVICAKCGKTLVRRGISKYNTAETLYCPNSKCDNISSKLCYVEEKIVEGLKEWLKQYRIDYNKCISQVNSQKQDNLKQTINNLKIELKKENEKLANIYNFLEDGTYTKEIFIKRSEQVSKNVAKINQTIDKCKMELEQEKIVEQEKNVLVPKVENLLDVYDMLETAEEKNDLLKAVLTQVTYLKTEKSIKKDSDPTYFTINLYPKINKYA